MHDADQVLVLLQIADLARQWPTLQPLHDRAMEKLLQIAKEHKDGKADAPAERPAPRPTARAGA